jgi:hypothetical protein
MRKKAFLQSPVSRLLPGWSKGSKSGRYVTPSGNEVSARQYKNARANFFGVSSYSVFERQKKLSSYGRWAEAYEVSTGKKANSLDSEFTRRLGELVFTPEGKLKGSEQLTEEPGGELALFLEFVGLRTAGATYPVGESPQPG